MASTLINDLKGGYQRGNLCMRIIYINVAVFIVCQLAEVIMRLFNQSLLPLFNLFEVPASIATLLMQPWALITYMFMHGGVLHLLFNMLWLYSFGNLFLQAYSSNHFRGLYLLGGLGAALTYIAAYNIFPYFEGWVDHSYMLGASGAVLAIVTATAYRMPHFRVQLFLLGEMQLKYLAWIAVGIDLLLITSDNAGGHIAHIGGACTGLFFAWSLEKGRDLTRWILWIIGSIESLFSPRKRKPKMRIIHGGKHESDYAYNARKREDEEEIDRILDKLKKSGYENLTTEEKRKLFDASRR